MSPEKRREDIYERGAAEIDDGDDLDHEVRAYFAEPDAPTFDMKAASNMRKLVELAGWESAREYVKRGIAGGNAFPVSWALRVFQSDKAKADVRAQSETVGKRTRPTGVVIHGEV